MSTLTVIHDANAREGAAHAYRFYRCTGDLGFAIRRFKGPAKTRVERRLISGGLAKAARVCR